jgi:hypothetical protein
MTRQAVNYLIGTMAHDAGLPNLHPHTLRHACGYCLADRGTDLRTMQDYLGHRDPRHTALHARLRPPVRGPVEVSSRGRDEVAQMARCPRYIPPDISLIPLAYVLRMR